MNTIKFNNTTFEVFSYNKNTYFGGESINSNASCSIKVTDMATLNALTSVPITSLQIYYNETLIYDLQDISAKIDSISEYLNTERMEISVNLTFDMQ